MKTYPMARRGSAGRPTLICLHSSGGSGAQWSALAAELGDEFDVMTPDLHGHGSAPAWLGAPVDIVAADTARIARIAAAVSTDVHLVGHSYGGAIALRVALHHPQCVASVAVYEPVPMRVLFDYNRRDRAASEVAEVAGTIRRELRGGNAERAAERFVDYWAGRAQWTRLAPERRADIAARMGVIRAHFAALAQDTLRLRDYAAIRAPVLYMMGRDTRSSARRMTELVTYALPHVETVKMASMGHLGPITHPTEVAASIAQFVRRQAAERAAAQGRLTRSAA